MTCAYFFRWVGSTNHQPGETFDSIKNYNGTESQRTPYQVSCDRAILDTQVFSGSGGARWVRPVGDFLDHLIPSTALPETRDISPRFSGIRMDVSEKSGTPKSSIFHRVFHYKPSILGYPYFWKHPNDVPQAPNSVAFWHVLFLSMAVLKESSWVLASTSRA